MPDPINSAAAAKLYANTAKAVSSAGGAEAPQQGPSFGDLMRVSLQDSLDTMKAGETASAKAVTGEANLQDVVGAITQAELTLETVVAVRDRLIGAYQEIMRMPI